MTTPLEQLAEIHRLRTQVDVLKHTKQELYDTWLAQNAPLLVSIADATERLANQEASVREAATAAFKADGNRRPFPGVEVKVFPTLVYEERDAFQWALEHQIALTLDKRVFEGIAAGPAGQSQSMGFVGQYEEPRAQIARDLSKVLGKATTL